MTPRLLRASAAPLLLALFVATGCGEVPQRGRLEIVLQEESGDSATRAAEVDFGVVLGGTSDERVLHLRNTGPGRVRVRGLATVSGGEPDVWKAIVEDVELEAGETIPLVFTFSPPITDAAGELHEVTFRIEAENDTEGEVTLRLAGRGLHGCGGLGLKLLDFGEVAVGDTFRHAVSFKNPTAVPLEVALGPVDSSSGDHAAFATEAGTFEIAPKGEREVFLDFAPDATRSYLAYMKIQVGAGCPQMNVRLTGTGVHQVLTWSPLSIDCGYVTPGLEATRQVTFTNGALRDVEVSAIKAQNANEFRVIAPAGQDPTRLLVPGNGGTATLEVGCRPQVLGARQTFLTFNTDLSSQPGGQITLKAFGGGPDIEVSPFPELSFGEVAYFAGASPPSFARRKLTVLNVGTPPITPDPRANLRLGTPDAFGNPQPPYFSVMPLDGNTSPDEFELTLPTSYDPAKGLVAKAGENAVELEVRFTPTSLGLKRAKVVLFSNDLDEPATELIVSAEAVALPPCTYSVTREALDFGRLSPPDVREQGFTIRNESTAPGDVCLLSGLMIGVGTHPFFGLPGGEIDSLELGPGETLRVIVRAQLTGTTPADAVEISGSVGFSISSPQKPYVSVPLRAQLGQRCLNIAGNAAFGTVMLGCGSETRTFNIHNVCSSPVTLDSVTIEPWGPAGGPDCPGAQPCDEFSLVSAPVLPTGGVTISPGDPPVAVQVLYRPADPGPDDASLVVVVTQSGSPATYRAPLSGAGSAIGLHADSFVQAAQPKADLLVVVDHSCSNAGYQQELGIQLSGLFSLAAASNADLQVGVISGVTNVPGTLPVGHLLSGPAHPEKILTPATSNVVDKFKSKVSSFPGVGSTASCLAPALAALTPPLINTNNSGFLRPGAHLSVFCMTDALDQSAPSANDYLDHFWSLKGHSKKSEFTFHAIAGFDPKPPAGCPYGSAPDDGKYAALVERTHGMKIELCSYPWPGLLNELGAAALGIRSNFFLTAQPDLALGPVEVAVNGAALAATTGTGQVVWTHDPVTNALRFASSYVPSPGDAIAVTFPTVCHP